ncbi:MAG: [FeFe] hydrogenase H-cluster maturation GTPase HydF [Bacillota bacterium]|nr:[FeFe] hydrogenase H-cluster maturation GTPase HydF [Bacillota bacterium]
MNETPRANRLHITIFGRRNAGKSSLFNALAGQNMAMVSDQPGTTTDPVYKSIEILPIGPCVLIDTAGLDDVGTLGEMRVTKSRALMDKTDLALMLLDPRYGSTHFEKSLADELKAREIPIIPVITKADLSIENASCPQNKITDITEQVNKVVGIAPIWVSSQTGEGIAALKQQIIEMAPNSMHNTPIVGDLLKPGSLCILVCPIDSAAPKGRLILPQVQTIRDILDHGSQALVVKETELSDALERLAEPPDLVITDSQVFKEINELLDPSIPLTSFSILFARYKGDLPKLLEGLTVLDTLYDGDKILIAEACTHHRQDDDIGTVKIPYLLKQYTGKKLDIQHCSGYEYPPDLAQYKLVIHCGACMLNRKEMLSRISRAHAAGVPITNYGLFLAHMQSILPRIIDIGKRSLV